METIEKNLEFPWDWGEIANNPNITIDFINRNLDKPFDWEKLKYNYMMIENEYDMRKKKLNNKILE